MDESLRPYFIFVEGADTLPKKVPVFLVYGEKEALRICEAIEETEYGEFIFSFVPCTTENVNKIAAWTEMALEVERGVYGEIVAGICYMIGQIYEGHKKLFLKPEENNANETEKPTDGPVEPSNETKRRGRLPKAESDAKRASMLATLREHPSLKDDVGHLARMVNVGESTVRRWLGEEQQMYLESKAARSEQADE
jgi:hypothetical protein